MKKRTKIIIVSCISVFVLIAAYFVYNWLSDEDIDKISKKVTIVSYESFFYKTVEKDFGKSYDKFNDEEKLDILKKMLTNENISLQVVSVRFLSKLNDKEKSLSILKSTIFEIAPEVAEEAIFSLKDYPKNLAEIFLKELIDSYYNKSNRNIPFSNVLRVTLVGSDEKNGINFEMTESQQKGTNLSDGSVYEINLLVPRGFDILFSFPNFDDNWDKFIDSKLISKFAKLEAYVDFKRMDLVSDYFKIKKIVEEKVGFLNKYFEPGKLFRDDLKLAMYESDILGVTFKGRNVEIFTNLVNILKVAGSKFVINEEMFNGAKIVTFSDKSGENTMSYAEVSEYFIFSTSINLVKRSLESFLSDNSKSITFDPSFQKEYNKLDLTGKKNFVFAYFQPSKLFVSNEENNYSSYLSKIALSVLNDINGGKLDLQSILGKNYLSKVNDDNLIKFIPKDVIGFYYSKNGNLVNLWKYLTIVESNLPDTPSDFEKTAGINIDADLLKKLTPQFYMGFSGIHFRNDDYDNTSALKLFSCFKIADQNNLLLNLQNMFNKLFDKSPQKQYYQGYEIFAVDPTTLNTLSNQIVENPVAPSFCLVDGYLLIGMNPKLLKDMIDTYKGSKQNISEMNLIANDNSEKFYINGNLLFDDYYKFIEKYSSRSKSISEFETEGKLKPFFELLKAIKKLEYSSKLDDYFFTANMFLTVD